MSKREIKDIGRQRIKWLYQLALEGTRKKKYDTARNYTKLMFKIAERSRVRIPRTIKRSICKRCGVPLIPGVTLNVRIRSEDKGSHIVAKCKLCGWIKRYYFKVRKWERS